MREKITKVYNFSELSDKAKEKALDHFRESVFTSSSDWAHVYEKVKDVANLLGIEFAEKKNKEPAIFFSGFDNIGDGACFEGNYSYKKESVPQIKLLYPNDEELNRIAFELQSVQRKYFFALTATMSHRGHYYHSGCMSVTVEDSRNGSRYHETSAESDMMQLMRDHADWIYKQLAEENDYQSSNEVLKEMIQANEYEFDADGNLA